MIFKSNSEVNRIQINGRALICPTNRINNEKFMAVLDTGAGASVIQKKIATKLKLKRFSTDNALIEF